MARIAMPAWPMLGNEVEWPRVVLIVAHGVHGLEGALGIRRDMAARMCQKIIFHAKAQGCAMPLGHLVGLIHHGIETRPDVGIQEEMTGILVTSDGLVIIAARLRLRLQRMDPRYPVQIVDGPDQGLRKAICVRLRM